MALRTHPLGKPVAASELARSLGLPWSGQDPELAAVSSIEEAEPGCLCFSTGEIAREFNGSAVIASEPVRARCTIISRHPRLDFIRALAYLERTSGLRKPGVPSRIHATASLGRNVVVEDDCVIEEGVVIEHNAVIHGGTRVGAYTRIRANAAIGGDGFGFERDASGEPVRFPHLGGVSIGKHVEVGSGACIARGALNDTVIEDCVKIDNLVQIAHNCHVGRGAMLASGANLCGGVRVGRDAWIGPQASVIQNNEVGEGALVGMGAVVVRPVPANCVYAGNPARLLRRTDGKS